MWHGSRARRGAGRCDEVLLHGRRFRDADELRVDVDVRVVTESALPFSTTGALEGAINVVMEESRSQEVLGLPVKISQLLASGGGFSPPVWTLRVVITLRCSPNMLLTVWSPWWVSVWSTMVARARTFRPSLLLRVLGIQGGGENSELHSDFVLEILESTAGARGRGHDEFHEIFVSLFSI